MLSVSDAENCVFVLSEGGDGRDTVGEIFVELLHNVFLRVVSSHGIGAVRGQTKVAMQVGERGHNRLSADVLHDGVLGNGNGSRLPSGGDMIAFNDKDGVRDSRPACSIDQTGAF